MSQAITPMNKTYGGLRWDMTYIDDPRLVDAARGQFYNISRPPLTGKLREDEIYKYTYNDNYRDYEDIDRGQILYYYRGDMRGPYQPILVNEGIFCTQYFQNPMETEKCYFPFVSTEKYCNQYMNDTQFHRNDILTKQMDRLTSKKYVVLK